MYDPCSSCPKGEYSQPCCSVQCSYGRGLDELKMLREQTKKLAEVVGGELVQGIDADTCAIEDLQTLLRNDFHAIGIVTVIRAINALKEQNRNKMPLTIEEVKALSDKVENNPNQWVWIEILDYRISKPGCGKVSAYYRVQYDYTHGEAFCCGYPGITYDFDYAEYGKTWFAYTHPPTK